MGCLKCFCTCPGQLNYIFANYQKLNVWTERVNYAICRANMCIILIGDALIFSSLKNNPSYCKVGIKGDDFEKTEFTSDDGFHCFFSMSFALFHVHQTFQWNEAVMLWPVEWLFVLVCWNEIIQIFTNRRRPYWGFFQHTGAGPQCRRHVGPKERQVLHRENRILGQMICFSGRQLASQSMNAINYLNPPQTVMTLSFWVHVMFTNVSNQSLLELSLNSMISWKQ